MKTISGTKENYDKTFDEKQRKEAIDVALDIRKFEIGLYWKRAAYFWTFIAATFAGYFLIYRVTNKDITLLFIVSCIGFTFSVAWYLANRGSKFWVNNWEVHVDYLEDNKIGPLYKTVVSPENFKFWRLLTAYPYSVTKINQILNLYVAGIWVFFAVHSLSLSFNWIEPFHNFNIIVIGIFTVIIIFCMLFFGKTNFRGRMSMSFVQRTLSSEASKEQ